MGNGWSTKQNREEEALELETFESLTCEICIEPIETAKNKFKNRDFCSHPYCMDCVITYIETKINDNNVSQIPCPAPDCIHNLDPLFFRHLIPPHVFVKWCDLLCESTLLGLERWYCPYMDCSALVVKECRGRVTKEKCPNCKRLFCFKCKKQWHPLFRCGEIRDQSDDVLVALAQHMRWARCPRCFWYVELLSGCKHIRCRCSANFCYNCGQLFHGGKCGCAISSYECCGFIVVTITIFLLLLMSYGIAIPICLLD